MRKELASVFLAAGLALATVGTASCKRQETPPPPTPIAASGEPRPQPESGLAWKQFGSEDFPYEISYPSNWKPIKRDGREMIVGETVNGLQTKVIVIAEPIGKLTLDDIPQKYIERFRDKEKLEFHQEKTKLAGFDAWIIIVKKNDGRIDRTEAFSNIGGQLWSLSLYADSSVAEKEIPKFKRMIDSFTLRPPLRAETPQKPSVAPAAPRAEPPRQEELKTIEKQAGEAALMKWASLFSTQQAEIFPYDNTFLKTNITNPGNIPLQVQWTGGVLGVGGAYGRGLKYTGELQIDKVKVLGVKILPQPSDAEKANLKATGINLDWDTMVSIGFIRRFRSVFYTQNPPSVNTPEKINKWLMTPDEPPQLPEFSLWEDEKIDIRASFFNGKWQGIMHMWANERRIDLNKNPRPLFGRLTLPSEIFSYPHIIGSQKWDMCYKGICPDPARQAQPAPLR